MDGAIQSVSFMSMTRSKIMATPLILAVSFETLACLYGWMDEWRIEALFLVSRVCQD